MLCHLILSQPVWRLTDAFSVVWDQRTCLSLVTVGVVLSSQHWGWLKLSRNGRICFQTTPRNGESCWAAAQGCGGDACPFVFPSVHACSIMAESALKIPDISRRHIASVFPSEQGNPCLPACLSDEGRTRGGKNAVQPPPQVWHRFRSNLLFLRAEVQRICLEDSQGSASCDFQGFIRNLQFVLFILWPVYSGEPC